jgi:chaperonin GroEL
VDDEERTDIINRLAALTGGMGVLKVGTNLKQEREILSNLSERALTAVSQAHRTGVVPGGGAAFVHARKALDGLELEGEENFGVKVLNDALDAPFLQIVKNAGIESPSVAALHLEDAGTAYAYDVVRKELVHAHETGLVDVTGVQTAVLETAISGALMALGTNTIVYHRDPSQSMEP